MTTKRPTWQQRHREEFNALWRRWYASNSARKKAWQKRRREELRVWWRELKATKACQRCGETAPECLHFHHRDRATKEFNLGAALGKSKTRILAEVAKCDVFCANCHMKEHWLERRK